MSPALAALLDRVAAPPDPLEVLRPQYDYTGRQTSSGAVERLRAADSEISDCEDALNDLAATLVEADMETEARFLQRLVLDIAAARGWVLGIRNDIEEVLAS